MAGSWNGTVYTGDATNEAVTGTSANEYIMGWEGDDQLFGLGGNDTIHGGYGSDRIEGGEGNDTLVDLGARQSNFQGIVGRDTILGGAGDDFLQFLSVDTGDIGDGGTGNDTVYINFVTQGLGTGDFVSFFAGPGGAASVVQINGINTVTLQNIEHFQVFTAGTDDILSLGAGNDIIEAGAGNDTLRGGAGNDTIDAGTGRVSVDGGLGDDLLSFDLSAATTALTLTNAATLNLGIHGTITGIEAFGTVRLGSGADTVTLTQTRGISLYSGGGADAIRATAFGDYVFLDGPGAASVWLGDGNDFLQYGGPDDTAGDLAYGGAGNDVMNLSSGADLIYADQGRDVVWAGPGADSAYGGEGNDVLFGMHGADILGGGEGDDSLDGDASGGFSFGDPQAEADRLFGGEGNDTLVVGLGADHAYGGAGNDVITHGFTTRQFVPDASLDRGAGGLGLDTLKIAMTTTGFGSAGDLTVTLAPTTRVVFEGVERGVFEGMERLEITFYWDGETRVTGGALADTVYTNNGNDTITGGAGNDLLYSGLGADRVDAGLGDDSVQVGAGGADVVLLGAGNDVLTLSAYANPSQTLPAGAGQFFGGTGTDTLEIQGYFHTLRFNGTQLFTGVQLLGTVAGFERVRLAGSYNDDIVVGMAGADTLSGGNGNDHLFGMEGNDTLGDGQGQDTLRGGTWADVFDMATDGATDLIEDFRDGVDRIRIFGQDFSTLTLTDLAPGRVRVAWGASDVLIVEDFGAGTLDRADLTAADFLFL
jgi:Ca2+-binding RTX toxin-like protein